MARYHSVSPNIWDREFRSLHKDHPQAQLVHLYIQTCRHRNSEGLFALPSAYIVADTGLSQEDVDEALEVLQAKGYLSYDGDNEVVLDRRALRFYTPTGEPQIKGALNCFQQVPRSPLKVEFVTLAFTLAKDLADRIIEMDGELAPPALAAYERDGRPSEERQSSEGIEGVSIPRVRARARARLEDESENESAHASSEKSARPCALPEGIRDPVDSAVKALGAEVVRQDGDAR